MMPYPFFIVLQLLLSSAFCGTHVPLPINTWSPAFYDVPGEGTVSAPGDGSSSRGFTVYRDGTLLQAPYFRSASTSSQQYEFKPCLHIFSFSGNRSSSLSMMPYPFFIVLQMRSTRRSRRGPAGPPHQRTGSSGGSSRHYATSANAHPRDDFPPRPRHRSVATWTIVHSGQPVPWASRSRWASQPRPLRGADPSSVPQPFRGVTIEDRHPADPLLPYTEEERQALCPSCGVPIIHRATHLRGPLHRVRMELTQTMRARATRVTESDLSAAISMIQRHRPELLLPTEPRPQQPRALDTDLIDLLEEDMPEN
ncbi:uncharacterized protein LOC135394412 [Ornithodoros turicata]